MVKLFWRGFTGHDSLSEHIKEKRKSLKENLDQVRESHLSIKKIIQKSFYMRYLNGTAFLNHHFIKLAFLESWIKIVPSGRRNKIFSLFEEKLNSYARSKGELKLTIPFICIDCRKII